MEALGKLGIDVRLLIAQALNFAILLFLLHRFLYKPLLAMLEKRREMIEKSVEEARAISEKLASVETQREKEFASARTKAAEIIEKATLHAEEKSTALIAKAKHEVLLVVDAAREKIRTEKEQMMGDAKEELSRLVLNASRALLSDISDAELTERLTKKALKIK
ncbi:F0F1 ATP synthase subunit B [Candidatus Uhrbacteria bacterium]|nr:F0F1 ATP synthase subunit B [Candidatus Uhrbacteria bacterium]